MMMMMIVMMDDDDDDDDDDNNNERINVGDDDDDDDNNNNGDTGNIRRDDRLWVSKDKIDNYESLNHLFYIFLNLCLRFMICYFQAINTLLIFISIHLQIIIMIVIIRMTVINKAARLTTLTSHI